MTNQETIKDELKELRTQIEMMKRVIGLFVEVHTYPDTFKFDEHGMTWKSPNWQQSKGAWTVATPAFFNGSYYSMLKSFVSHRRDLAHITHIDRIKK